MSDVHRLSWEARTAALARHINLGWWLDHALPAWLGLGLIGAPLLLVLRYFDSPALAFTWPGLAALGLLIAGFAFYQARRRFETRDTARVRLEDALQLQARLSAAHSGVGDWPQLPSQGVALPVQWRWRRAVTLLGLSLGLLLLASFVPMAQRGVAKPRVIEKPSAVKQVEGWVEELRKDEAIDPKAAEQVQERIEELLSRPKDQWYEHASLEAAEHLRDQMGKALQELGTQMEQAAGTLSTLSEMAQDLSPEEMEGLAQQLGKTLEDMRAGSLQGGEELQKQLNSIDPESLAQLSPEQKKALAERMKQNAQHLREALANAPQFEFKEGVCKNPGEGEGESERPGKGKPARGKGDADLTLKKDEANLKTNNLEALSPMLDPSRIAPGDLLGTSDAKPKVDPKAYAGPQAGGSLEGLGSGGGAVGKSNLVPAEREVLKKFFR